ncbi:FRG domain-containing protein [Maridesulfovibrio sp.]|uniref:FRG domain-containing protein n=1 Tax=Maridesulfovibrio sp. TaxID=2795000 RepID=UPI002A189732|nr:FRG domain-containing protein [Maridesulfovibrio sp.]
MKHPRLALDDFQALDMQSKWNAEKFFFDIETPHALSQLAGYAKYSLSEFGPVYFRGQSKHYGEMRPSLFRGIERSGTGDARVRQLQDYIKLQAKENSIFITNTPENAYEPILQHYGFKTRWIDIVDNIWSSLWFACHKATTAGKYGQYLHFEENDNEYCFIYLMQFGNEARKIGAGHIKTSTGMNVIDLRTAAPSMYLRPHSQHGLLARASIIDDTTINYQNYIVLTLRIKTTKALKWLGQTPLTQTHFMFPPATVDQGYQVFLDKKMPTHDILGCIHYIGT